jgi:hypothetical protein
MKLMSRAFHLMSGKGPSLVDAAKARANHHQPESETFAELWAAGTVRAPRIKSELGNMRLRWLLTFNVSAGAKATRKSLR